MEDSKNTSNPLGILGEGKQPVVLVAQLMRSIAQMQHVDEVFVWLSNALVRYLGLPIVQFWTTEVVNGEQAQVELRALTMRNGSLPQDVYLNKYVLAVVERLLHERRSVMSRPVQGLFPPYQAALFTLCGLHYWAGYFLESDTLFSSSRTTRASKKASIPLTIAVSLFTEVPLSPDQMRTINFVLKQAMRIIINRKFHTFQNSLRNASKEKSVTLADIIPMRSQDLEQFQASNPLALASIIADKRARRLYSAVDGRKSVAELARITRLEQEELSEALRYLFQQQKIAFYTSAGEHVQHFPRILSAS